MAVVFGPAESVKPVDDGYSSWQLDTIPVTIRIHSRVIGGIGRDILENEPLAAAGVLLGHGDESDPALLWIEGYRRTAEDAPSCGADAWEVGAYSGASSAAGPDEPPPPVSAPEECNFFLRIAPDAAGALEAQCFFRGAGGTLDPAFPLLDFRTPAPASPEPDRAPHRPRRLVPDFERAGDTPRPARALFSETEPPSRTAALLSRFWPILAALALVGGLVGLLFFFGPAGGGTPAAGAAPSAGAARPLGLYVDPAGQNWRISWNRDATVLRDARGVRLFVKDGDDQTLLELSAQDLEAATSRYEARTRDVTFRLEATGRDGRVTAESFRLLRPAPENPATAVNAPASVSPETTPPRASHKVAPVVSAAIRPRIRGKIAVDVRVQIDRQGRVTGAVPVSQPRGTLDTYLAGRAVRAARAWRFHPAMKNGRPVPGSQTLHFAFER